MRIFLSSSGYTARHTPDIGRKCFFFKRVVVIKYENVNWTCHLPTVPTCFEACKPIANNNNTEMTKLQNLWVHQYLYIYDGQLLLHAHGRHPSWTFHFIICMNCIWVVLQACIYGSSLWCIVERSLEKIKRKMTDMTLYFPDITSYA